MMLCHLTLIPCLVYAQNMEGLFRGSLMTHALRGLRNRLLRKLYKDQFSKTTLCGAFEKGLCGKGDSCKFAHGLSTHNIYIYISATYSSIVPQ